MMIRQYELVERVKGYDPNIDESALNRAYVFAMQVHGQQKRASGDPYFAHPLEVAGILTEYYLDYQSIITALLHDTVEDTGVTIESIEEQFGIEVAKLVDGVTKLNKIEIKSEKMQQARNFQKFLVAMSDDIRVLLVKLADRLHNMRTLHYIKNPQKRKRTSLETMEIYAPLAERIGMQQMKEELQELAFSELNADARNSIVKRIEHFRFISGKLVDEVCSELQLLLEKNGLKVEIVGREKKPYSIWQKMHRKNLSFESMCDIMAFRIFLDTPADCYQALGVIHSTYSMVPGRFKDYLSTPKPNGYRSLHTTIIRPKSHRIEVQIRTRHMHEIAEMGVAAHWVYKQKPDKVDIGQYRWMRELLEILEHALSLEEFLEHTKMEMFQDQVFCFTPKGDLINLPFGASAIDFAYAIHTNVGHCCGRVRINGRLRPLRTRLANGDQVELIRSTDAEPSSMWLHYVVTGKARSAIRRFLYKKEREQNIYEGHSLIQNFYRKRGISLKENDFKVYFETFEKKLSRPIKSMEDIYELVGRGEVSVDLILRTVLEKHKIGLETSLDVEQQQIDNLKQLEKPPSKFKNDKVSISGVSPGMAVHFANCCCPLPGDLIVGIIVSGRGVAIHTMDCHQVEVFINQPERWIDVSWNDQSTQGGGVHTARLEVSMENTPKALAQVANTLGSFKSNIRNLVFNRRADDFLEIKIDIEVKDVTHLTNVIAQLRLLDGINDVERIKH